MEKTIFLIIVKEIALHKKKIFCKKTIL